MQNQGHDKNSNDLPNDKEELSPIIEPLSWEEARSRLRFVLEQYLKQPFETASTVTSWVDWDLDLYAAALPVSLALFILAATSLKSKIHGGGRLNAAATVQVYIGQLVASCLILIGTLLSIVLTTRRRKTCKNDRYVAKKRAISKFLAVLDKHSEENVDNSQHTTNAQTKNTSGVGNGLELLGTSLTDVFPVYRRQRESEDWHKLPALLLVQGDVIALQIGDICPAPCKLQNGQKIAALERITSATLGRTPISATASLPLGKTTLGPESLHLLTLCNAMFVCTVEESPLMAFLNRPDEPGRLPQIHRQLQDIRRVLFVFATVVFVVSLGVLFIRPDVKNSDLSIILHAPFLASLAALPFVGPCFLFFLEVLGTSRILVSVHPHAANRGQLGMGQAELMIRYAMATASSRLSLQDPGDKLARCFHGMVRRRNEDISEAVQANLVPVPPASLCMFEKLGVVTAFALIDDELACEPHSTPQQLLIPSGEGLKLLDISPKYESESRDDDSERDGNWKQGSSHESDSDSETEGVRGHPPPTALQFGALRRRPRGQRKIRGAKVEIDSSSADVSSITEPLGSDEVQFEDPTWWQHLPSLKCIGLACLLVDDDDHLSSQQTENRRRLLRNNTNVGVSRIEEDLVRHIISIQVSRRQLKSLAHCIGFCSNGNSNGERGDITPFTVMQRLKVISSRLVRERLRLDSHAVGLEASRRWGLLAPDATAVIVQDQRSKAYQLLTVGDPKVVVSLCHEAWQGENSTILPLSSADRKRILETCNDWKLGDLDVYAFSYTPLPQTFEQLLQRESGKGTGKQMIKYLVEHTKKDAGNKELSSQEWSLINSQIFLGVLGSTVTPRKEIEKLLATFSDAGVRFVYFSPRNMRRTKEIARQMGIDVAWNCAISLRPLHAGEDDPHRMVSNYADWDINAKLPHGIDAVRRHLKEVDNVPLLVSLFTDVTKINTKEMIQTFQEYCDTVMAVGLSHLYRNAKIFSASDLSVGVDVIIIEQSGSKPRPTKELDLVLPHEIAFVTSMSATSCVFRLKGPNSTKALPGIIASGRAALEAGTSSVLFVITGSVTFSWFVLFSLCSTSTTVPFIPMVGSVLYLQIALPWIGMAMATGAADNESMKRVPPKNDLSLTFAKKEGFRLYVNATLQAILPAVLPQVLHLIAFGELMLYFESEFVAAACGNGIKQGDWVALVRCKGLRYYSGPALTDAGTLVIAVMMTCMIISSASFVHPTRSLVEEPPWNRNQPWLLSVCFCLVFVAIYLLVTLHRGTFSALPWYFFVLMVVMPFICLAANEAVKRNDRHHIKRAYMLRRLQFETRLGMWSPK